MSMVQNPRPVGQSPMKQGGIGPSNSPWMGGRTPMTGGMRNPNAPMQNAPPWMGQMMNNKFQQMRGQGGMQLPQFGRFGQGPPMQPKQYAPDDYSMAAVQSRGSNTGVVDTSRMQRGQMDPWQRQAFDFRQQNPPGSANNPIMQLQNRGGLGPSARGIMAPLPGTPYNPNIRY